MSSPLVLLVARSASRSQTYREALDRLGISCLAISAIKEVAILTAGTPFSGILLDMPLLIKTTPSDKIALEDVTKALPSAYLNITPANDLIRLLTANNMQGTAKTLEDFSVLCKNFTPRIVHLKQRYNLYLNALLSSAEATERQEQTTTLNVSSGGCFLFSANNQFQVGQPVAINFVGLQDTTIVQASICWLQRWGGKWHNFPGIGVKFEVITDNQAAQIVTLIGVIKP